MIQQSRQNPYDSSNTEMQKMATSGNTYAIGAPELPTYYGTDNPISSWWNKGLNAAQEGIYDRQWNQYVQNQNWAREDMANVLRMQREDTAHQREVSDMRAAGLNPAARNGQGASSDVGFTPGQPVVPGSGASDGTNPITSLVQIAQMASTVAGIAKSAKEISKMGAEISNIKADTGYKDKLTNFQQINNEFFNDVYNDRVVEAKLKNKHYEASTEDLRESAIYRRITNSMAEFDKEHQLDRYTFEMMFNDVEYKYQKILNDIGEREITTKDLQNAFSARELEFLKITGLYQNMPAGMADISMRCIGNAVKAYKASPDSKKIPFWEWVDTSIEQHSFWYTDKRYSDSATQYGANFLNTALQNLVPNIGFSNIFSQSSSTIRSHNQNYNYNPYRHGRFR